MIGVLDGDHSIVAFSLFAVALFSLNDADDPALYDAAGECRLIH